MNIINAASKYIILLALVVFMLLGLTSTIARGMLVLIFCAIVYCLCRCLGYLPRREVSAIFVLLAVNTLYFVFGDMGRHSGFYANIVLNLGLFFFSYYLSLKGRLSEKDVLVTYILLLLASSYRFFVEEAEMLYERNDQRGTMNMAYAFVIYMPFVFYVRNKVLSTVLVLFALFMVLNGAKRGAIFIYVISVIYYMYYTYFKGIEKLNYKYAFLGLIAVIATVYLANEVYINNLYLQDRLELTMEGGTNDRDRLYRAIWGKWSEEGSFIHFVFGYGFCSSLDIAGNRAHNDWLEMMATAGLVGEITYVFYIANLYRARNIIKDILDKRVINLILLILFVKSFFSMSYCSVENMAIFLLLGYVTGKNRSNLQQTLTLPDMNSKK